MRRRKNKFRRGSQSTKKTLRKHSKKLRKYKVSRGGIRL